MARRKRKSQGIKSLQKKKRSGKKSQGIKSLPKKQRNREKKAEKKE